MAINFCSLSSGSSGNCYYLGNESAGILIDAGISAGAVRKFLKELGIPFNTIMGVLVTHNHTDHTRGLEVLSRRHNLPIYTTERIRKSIISNNKRIQVSSFREINLEQRANIAGLDIEAFPVSHDAPETVGFHIFEGDKKVTIATDLGHICPVAEKYMRKANLLVIESNYDEQMLLEGRYPYFLKARIHSDHGHLSNQQTATFVADIITDNLSHICLAHLSKNNNRPEKALDTLDQTLSQRGIVLNGHPQITVLNRYKPSALIRLN